jgi:hypothetical protein
MTDDRERTHWPGCWRDPRHHACAAARVEEMEAVLSRIQWIMETDLDGKAAYKCPWCGEASADGHHKDCLIAAALPQPKEATDDRR